MTRAAMTYVVILTTMASASIGSAVIGMPVGLAIEVDNGIATPLQVKHGQTFYLNQIDLRASTTSKIDEGVSGLRTRGDFASLAWSNIGREEQEFVLLPNVAGTFTRRAFFRGAVWMTNRSTFRLEQVDGRGEIIGRPITVDAGLDHDRRASDDFFVRRFRAVQWTRDCHTTTDCAGATRFEEEALVELRNAMHPERTFTIDPRTTALRLHWSILPGRPYTIPLTQVKSPPFSYGFSIEVDVVTPPRSDGSYAPGSDITFRVTLRDGSGKRLHPAGALPSYNEVVFGPNAGGIQYYRAFFDPTTT